jgi:hypothetical protein
MVDQGGILRLLLGLPDKPYELDFIKGQLPDDNNLYKRLKQLEKCGFLEYDRGKRPSKIRLMDRTSALHYLR